MNLARKLSDVAIRCGNRPAIIFENTVHAYDDLEREVERYSAMLAGLNVEPGDRVAIQVPKQMEFIYLELAILSVGAIALPLNTDYTAEEIEYFLTDSDSSWFFTDRQRFSHAEGKLKTLTGLKIVLVDSSEVGQALSLDRELEKAPRSYMRQYPRGANDVAVICYTSGTTGRPKGAMITHKNLISNMTALHEIWGWTDRDVLLHALPLFHVHGLFVALHGGIYAGATIIMQERFDPARIWETIEREKCTLFMGVPTMYQRLLNRWESMDTKPTLGSMRVFISGSAPLLEAQFSRFEHQTGFRILERYGMTEAGMIASNRLDPNKRKAKSVGYPLPGVEIRVVSQSGQDVSPGEVGEVLVRGDNVFKGYWRMPEKTGESFENNWLKTGDLGYQDPTDDARLYLVGRAKELIITGGYNVYPKEVENVLEGHVAIREAAVIGLPDVDFGEKVTAVVVRNESSADVSSESLINYCKSHLASYKCPKTVFFVDGLPRNAMGKLQKNELTNRFTGEA